MQKSLSSREHGRLAILVEDGIFYSMWTVVLLVVSALMIAGSQVKAPFSGGLRSFPENISRHPSLLLTICILSSSNLNSCYSSDVTKQKELNASCVKCDDNRCFPYYLIMRL